MTVAEPNAGSEQLQLDLNEQEKLLFRSVDEFLLDDRNPRLPENMHGKTQRELIEYVANTYNAIEVGESISRHGYFGSEPLIAIRNNEDSFTVVEGNRRLAALKLLLSGELRGECDLGSADEWAELAESDMVPDHVWIVVVGDRDRISPVIGFRHIAGIEPWEPFAKARFIANLIDEQDLSFEETGRVIGEKPAEVRKHYRNYHIIVQAKEEFEIDTSYALNAFGVFTRAMISPGMRAFIDAPAQADVVVDQHPISHEYREQLSEVIVWLHGDSETSAVIRDSRQLTDFGKILSSNDAVAVLRTTGDFEEAYQASHAPRELLLNQLTQVHSNLNKILESIGLYSGDEDVMDLFNDCFDLVAKIRELLNER